MWSCLSARDVCFSVSDAVVQKEFSRSWKQFLVTNFVHRKASQALPNYIDAMRPLSSSRSLISTPILHWQAPATGWFKINWDVAIQASSNKIGVGVIFWDSKGTVLV